MIYRSHDLDITTLSEIRSILSGALLHKSLPKYESEIRQIVNSHNFTRKQITQLINKLHSIFNMNGVPEVKKADLEKNE